MCNIFHPLSNELFDIFDLIITQVSFFLPSQPYTPPTITDPSIPIASRSPFPSQPPHLPLSQPHCRPLMRLPPLHLCADEPVLITGLQPATVYGIRAASRNMAGLSTFSKQIMQKTNIRPAAQMTSSRAESYQRRARVTTYMLAVASLTAYAVQAYVCIYLSFQSLAKRATDCAQVAMVFCTLIALRAAPAVLVS